MNPHRRTRILCVDEEATCSLLCSLLGLINCEAETATTMGEGLAKAREGKYDLYVLDSWLPGGSGVELCRRIREYDLRTPIIFYSDAAYDSEREAAMAAGAQRYLVKPAQISMLLDSVRELLRLPEPATSYSYTTQG